MMIIIPKSNIFNSSVRTYQDKGTPSKQGVPSMQRFSLGGDKKSTKIEPDNSLSRGKRANEEWKKKDSSPRLLVIRAALACAIRLMAESETK